VHREHEIGVVEVARVDLSGRTGQLQTDVAGSPGHALIRRRTDVPRSGPGGPHLEVDAGQRRRLADRGFGGRGTADVAEADGQHDGWAAHSAPATSRPSSSVTVVTSEVSS